MAECIWFFVKRSRLPICGFLIKTISADSLKENNGIGKDGADSFTHDLIKISCWDGFSTGANQ